MKDSNYSINSGENINVNVFLHLLLRTFIFIIIAAEFGTRISDGRRMAGCRVAAVRILEVQVQSISLRVHYSIMSARHRVLAD